MKIAFASTDNIHVNQHFGWCEKFYIYEIKDNQFSLINEIDSSLKFDNEVEKLKYKISCIDSADILYVLQIGPKASNMVQMSGTFPIKSSKEDEKIEDVLNTLIKMMNDNPPIWLLRIIHKNK
jgi:nitrogen fixation protein NifX